MAFVALSAVSTATYSAEITASLVDPIIVLVCLHVHVHSALGLLSAAESTPKKIASLHFTGISSI
jgi:hypothetical protein